MKVALAHESLNQLLPWYANETLSPEERAAVEEHLENCVACQRELAWLHEVSETVKETSEEVPDTNLSFAKTLEAVEGWEKSKRPAKRWSFASWFDAMRNPSVPFARLVFVAQFALILVLGLVAFLPSRDNKGGFKVLTGPEVVTRGARLTISFNPNTTVEQLNRILSSAGAKVVSGPSASGMYVIELSIPAEKESEVQSVIEKMRSMEAVRFVERQP